MALTYLTLLPKGTSLYVASASTPCRQRALTSRLPLAGDVGCHSFRSCASLMAVATAATCWRRSQLRRGASGKRFKTRLQAAAMDASKPERTTLYVKAGPDGCSLGDCPFAHSVQMVLQLKGVDYDVVPCTQETKPQWLLEEVGGKMPCVCHAGIPHTETSEILSWVDQEFPEPSLAPPENLTLSENFRLFFGLFPSLARYTKNTDPNQDSDLKLDLQIKLSSLRAVLGQVNGDFLCGEKLTLLDCELLTQLYILENATAHFKGFSLADFPVTEEVRMYYEKGSALKEFMAGAYPTDVCTWGWGQARGDS